MTKDEIIRIIEDARDLSDRWCEDELSEKLSEVMYYLFETLES